jgi:hypothetical protein
MLNIKPHFSNPPLDFIGKGLKGPPIECLVTELLYFFIVFGLCILIYIKVNKAYNLTKHKGIYFFKNTFMYFALAYFLRLLFLSMILLSDLPRREFMIVGKTIVLPLFSFFSTLAILSLAVTVFIRKLKNVKHLNLYLFLISFLSLIITLITMSHRELLLIQTITFFCAVILVFYKSFRSKNKKVFSHNNVNYLLIFIFWILSTLAFNNRLLSHEFKIPLYIFSTCVFIWIYLRVNSRLSTNAKKT